MRGVAQDHHALVEPLRHGREVVGVPAGRNVVRRADDVEVSLRARLSELETDLIEGGRFPPRVFLVESEYQRVVPGAELDYVRGLVADLRAGLLDWDYRM